MYHPIFAHTVFPETDGEWIDQQSDLRFLDKDFALWIALGICNWIYRNLVSTLQFVPRKKIH